MEETDTQEPQQGPQQGPTLQDIINTPMAEDEARKALAEIDVQMAQLGVMRYKALDQLNQIDEQIARAGLDRTIVLRRALNAEAGK